MCKCCFKTSQCNPTKNGTGTGTSGVGKVKGYLTWVSNVNHFVTVKRPQPVCATFFHFLILNNSCLWLSEFSLWTDISASYMIGFGWFQPGRESSYCIKHQVSVHSYWKMPPVWLINSDLEITSTFWELDCTSTLSPEWSYNSWQTGRFGHTHTHRLSLTPRSISVLTAVCAASSEQLSVRYSEKTHMKQKNRQTSNIEKAGWDRRTKPYQWDCIFFPECNIVGSFGYFLVIFYGVFF